MTNNVIANVSEDTRRNGRVAPQQLFERLTQERDRLIEEKRDIEYRLNLVESWKRDQLSVLLSRRLGKDANIAATAALESETHKKKAGLIAEKRAIEKRLHDIKTTLREKRPPSESPQREDVAVLLRIESLLLHIAERLGGDAS